MTPADQVPELPPRCAAHLRLCFDERATASDLLALMRGDPELARRFLRIASGECFGAGRIKDLPRAIVRTGFPFARKWLALSSLGNVLAEWTGRSLGTDPYWRRALCRAMAADALEDFFSPRSAGEAGLVAFLWECGGLLAGPDAGRAVILVQSARMVRAWGLPERAWGVLESASLAEPGPDSLLLARVCHAADLFAAVCFGDHGDIHGFLATAGRLFDAPLDTVEDVFIGSLDLLRNVADRMVQQEEVRQAILDLLAKATGAFRDLLPGSAGAQDGQALPSFDTLDMNAARDTLEAVAHELRNPLMVVGGFARKLAASLDATTREHEYAQVILEEGLRIEELFKGLEGRGTGG